MPEAVKFHHIPEQAAEKLLLRIRAPLHSLRKKSALHLILGGAAVHRCDNSPTFNGGFSRRGQTVTQEILFPQVVQRCRKSSAFKSPLGAAVAISSSSAGCEGVP
jgi:hypothetical protein